MLVPRPQLNNDIWSSVLFENSKNHRTSLLLPLQRQLASRVEAWAIGISNDNIRIAGGNRYIHFLTKTLIVGIGFCFSLLNPSHNHLIAYKPGTRFELTQPPFSRPGPVRAPSPAWLGSFNVTLQWRTCASAASYSCRYSNYTLPKSVWIWAYSQR